MSSPNSARRDECAAEDALALLKALSIALKGAPAGGSAKKRLGDLEAVEGSLRALGERSRSLGSEIVQPSKTKHPLIIIGQVSTSVVYSLLAIWMTIVRGSYGEAWLVALGAAYFAFAAWSSWRVARGSPSELVRSRIEQLECALRVEKEKVHDALRVEKQEVYQELAKRPEVRHQIVGDHPGNYSIGVTRSPNGEEGLAFHLVVAGVGGGNLLMDGQRPVEVDGLTIPVVVVDGGSHGPELL